MFSVQFKTTDELPKPSPNLINQVIGQDEAVKIVLSAVKNKRHALLLGDPGVGKSMMVKAFGQLLEHSSDFKPYSLIARPNIKNSEKPIVDLIEGRMIEETAQIESPKLMRQPPSIFTLLLGIIVSSLVLSYILNGLSDPSSKFAVIAAISVIGSLLVFLILFLNIFGATKASMPNSVSPADVKPLVLYECKKRPLVRASAYNTTKLLGDIKHCPLGGKPPIGTPPHKRVIIGAIHEAHKGILYVDEIKTMPVDVQDYILTALQDKQLAISGRNPNSSGASVETNPIPCDLTLIMSGNMDDASNLRAPLLDRIDYKVVLKNKMDNNQENRDKLLQFIVQELENNNLRPMSYEACCEIVRMAQLLSGSKNKLTLRLRQLSNIIKMANDIATGKELSESIEEMSEKEVKPEVTVKAVKPAEKKNTRKIRAVVGKLKPKKSEEVIKEVKPVSKAPVLEKDDRVIELDHINEIISTGIYSMSKQVAIDYLKNFKRYKNIVSNDKPKIGVIHGLAVLGADGLGDVTKIITKIVKSKHPRTNLLNISGDLAKHSITLASALSKKLVSDGTLSIAKAKGEVAKEDLDLAEHEIYIQFSQSYSKIDGDSATAAACLSIISSLLNIPLKQDFCITGSLDLNGEILAIGGVNEKINAAKEYGFKRVIIPQSNFEDVIDPEGIEVIPVTRLEEIIPLAFELNNL
ncbi:ATP-dependent protease LonB [Methanococcus maripaludis]|uniref:Archaeal Lon protease n=1 Tax=Methanococcus maripaludis (strain DSM 14266 / JCM 13030 / NBRC 101832 / S2 / LL) TaxID=267377 RepID=Q6LY07_METMP|nr:ATP-dependent protease LonB [Methanococcus maripaludis]CAF30742.1 Eukaryotic thiol (cysteine) protease, active site:ATP/GTP-binding site motif A (P-loop):Sigma-54 factor interaction domain:Pu [Methanococcus maripaludis S2]